MKGLEDQLREAYREAADTVRPHAIRGLDLDPGWPAEDTSRAAPRRADGAVACSCRLLLPRLSLRWSPLRPWWCPGLIAERPPTEAGHGTPQWSPAGSPRCRSTRC